jgi:hypothetical protein
LIALILAASASSDVGLGFVELTVVGGAADGLACWALAEVAKVKATTITSSRMCPLGYLDLEWHEHRDRPS